MAHKNSNVTPAYFVQAYIERCGDNPTEEQALLIKYFKEAKDDLPCDSTRQWFHKAWRQTDVIHCRGLGSKDTIVMQLLRLDDAIHDVVNDLLPDESDNA